MHDAVREKWVAALRSGEYKQAKGALCLVGEDGVAQGHCCLGVLCELAIKDGVALSVTQDSGGNRQYAHESAILPRAVAEWAGLTMLNPSIRCSAGECANLAALNDGGTDFMSLANLIEESVGECEHDL